MKTISPIWDIAGAAWVVLAVAVHYLPQLGLPVPFAAATAVYAALVILGLARLALSLLGRSGSAV
ncbi:MAG: hypothetical protein ACKO5K_16875 [Armatimonadota bacterium]